MRSRVLIAFSALLAVLVVAAVGTIVYDHGHRDTIAKGVTVGGVDVGGLHRAEATAKLRRAILEPLQRTIVVDHGRQRWRLTAREARVTTNLDATVEDALARSRTGNILQRTVRGITGGSVDAHLQPQVTFSDAAVIRLLDRVRTATNRPSINATVKFSAAGLQTTPSRDGLAVDASGLHRRIKAALASPTASRRFSAVTHHVAPKVTTDQLAEQYGTALIVDRADFKLKLYKRLKEVKSYSVAIGAVGRETPAGLYHIQNKAVNPAWTKPNSDWVPKDQRGEVVPGGDPANPLKARWLGIFDGAGIHGIDPSEYGSIGHAASHGCVRMRIPDVEDLYPQVPVGAPIYIA
ncbi:L,D-transpeptidase family protein [Baekduia soli]|uniref:L,D-transpeptidase family protein n=1 Tax=Baekduia soli TaxID=496014 RepID=A0A5B8U6X9_9ACTN|nr:L,D-transpeptidase family protein [Baekduia soli]QEC48691.1 L,D-transpeptidase family protein [Baekduia soli]